jgi:T4 RnlA family RNA ligase
MEKEKKKLKLYPFPNSLDIKEVENVIKEVNPFVKNAFYSKKDEVNNHLFFNYKFFTPKTFPDPFSTEDEKMSYYYSVLRECRGIIFDITTGKPISRSFHKFFNINGPLEETLSKYMDLNDPHVWLEKLDGTMTNALLFVDENNNETVKFRTKMGTETTLAKQIEKFISSSELKDNYHKFISKWIKKGYTPIFEFVSPENEIVIKYDSSKLVFLALRNVEDGSYINYKESIKIVSEYDIPHVKEYDFQSKDIEKILEEISGNYKN